MMRALYPSLTESVPSGDALERWLERWGGWLVAGFVHLALLAVFSNQIVMIQQIGKPKDRLQMRFRLPDLSPSAPSAVAIPSPPPPTPAQASPALTPVVATTADPNAKDSDESTQSPAEAQTGDQPNEGDAAREALARLSASALGKPILPPETQVQIQNELARLQRERALQEVEKAKIKTQVHKLEVEAKGRRFTLDTDGGRTGAIRTLDVTNMPDAIVTQVFTKYHIQIQRGVAPSEAKPSFLNAAVTGEGTFRNVPVNGLTDVFILSPTAVSMMAMLEMEALQRRGFDPTRTRVREIRFGIIRNDKGEWDLGVTKLQTEELK